MIVIPRSDGGGATKVGVVSKKMMQGHRRGWIVIWEEGLNW